MHILLGALIGLLVPYIALVIKGPSVWDRLLGTNLIATKIIVIIVVYAAITETPFLLDFAIIYALSGFIGTIFIALFLQERNRRRNEERNKERNKLAPQNEPQNEFNEREAPR